MAAGVGFGHGAGAEDDGHLQMRAGELFPGHRPVPDARRYEQPRGSIEGQRLAADGELDFAAQVFGVIRVGADMKHDFVAARLMDVLVDVGVGLGHGVEPAHFDISVAAGDEVAAHQGHGGVLMPLDIAGADLVVGFPDQVFLSVGGHLNPS